MKHLIPKQYSLQARTAIVVIGVGVLFVGILVYLDRISGFISHVLGILSPFFVGAALAFLQMPITRRADQFLRATFFKKRPHSKAIHVLTTVISLVLLIAAITAFIWILLPQVLRSGESLIRQITKFVNENDEAVNDFLKRAGFISSDTDPLNSTWQNIMTAATNYMDVLASIAKTSYNVAYQFVFQLLVGLITSFYFLMNREKLGAQVKKVCYAMMKKENAERLIYWGRYTNRVFAGFTTGKIIDSAIIGVICYIGMLIMGLEYPLLISVIIGVTNILPFFGPFIGAIPSILILLIIRPAAALEFAIFILVLQQIDGNVIGPKILGDYTGMSALWTMFAIILGSGLFGFIGMLISVPTFAVFYALIRTLIDKRLAEKGLPVPSDAYRS